MSLFDGIIKGQARQMIQQLEGLALALETAIRNGQTDLALRLIGNIRSVLARAKGFLK